MSDPYFYETKNESVSAFISYQMNFPPHLHHQIEICCQLEGELAATIDGESRAMRSGDAAIILPNCVHSYHCPQPGKTLVAIIDPALTGAYMERLLRSGCPCPFVSDAHPDVAMALERLARDEDMDEPLKSAYVGVAVGRLLCDIPLRERSAASDADILRRVLLDISEHIGEKITLDKLAGRLYMNRYSISRLFSERMGCSLSDYVNTLRVDRARNMLRDPTISMNDVIERSGFESERTFYRVFREKFGCSPRRYYAGYNPDSAIKSPEKQPCGDADSCNPCQP